MVEVELRLQIFQAHVPPMPVSCESESVRNSHSTFVGVIRGAAHMIGAKTKAEGDS